MEAQTMDWPAIAVAAGTWVGVCVTVGMVKKQLRVELYLKLVERFDGGSTVSARKKLALQLLNNTQHEEIQEEVMNLFEDMGMLLRRRYLDCEMVRDTFGYYGRRWWTACKDYVAEERSRRGDPTLFTDFEELARRISRRESKELRSTEPQPSEIKAFLEDETRLTQRNP
jgi:hypothetical protein